MRCEVTARDLSMLIGRQASPAAPVRGIYWDISVGKVKSGADRETQVFNKVRDGAPNSVH